MARRRESDDVQRVEITASRGARRMAFVILFGPFLFVVLLLTLSEMFSSGGQDRALRESGAIFVPEASR